MMDSWVLPFDISKTLISPKPTFVVETVFFIIAMWIEMIELVFLLPCLLPLSIFSRVTVTLPQSYVTCHYPASNGSPASSVQSPTSLCSSMASRTLTAWLYHIILAMSTLLLLLWTLWTVFWVVPHCYTLILLFPRSGISFCLYS